MKDYNSVAADRLHLGVVVGDPIGEGRLGEAHPVFPQVELCVVGT